MRDATDIVFEFDTSYGHYQVVDMVYDGRSARVLFSGDRRAAQSGVATDDKPDLLFDYNQRMYELVTGIEPRRLLLIGGGMCTLPAALLADMLDIQIDVVELDDELEVVARRYFGIPDSSRLNIIHSDGLAYLASNQNRYDMIIVDAFTHDLAEPTLSSSDAIAHLTRSLNSGGVLMANVIAAYFGRRSQALQRLVTAYSDQFAGVALFPASQSLSLWLPQNLLLVAQLDEQTDIDQHLRYRRLEKVAQPFNLGRDLRA